MSTLDKRTESIKKTEQKDKLLKLVVGHYLEARRFNGLPARDLDFPERNDLVAELVQEDKVMINFGDLHPNSHIKAFEAEDTTIQLLKLKEKGLEDACLYPSKAVLKDAVDTSKYAGRPFTLMLALGEPQLSYRVFELSVLEPYRNDPRFIYDVSDVEGSISIRGDHYDSATTAERDRTFLDTFGFAYDREVTSRYVAAFIWYLSNLTPEHQQIWHAKMVSGDFFLHPEYARMTAGHWPEGLSIFEAFLEEVHQINKLAELMGRPALFRQDFEGAKRPRELAFLLRPTLREFNAFVHVLDKVLSENINLDFFRGEVSLEEVETRADGTEIRKRIGSIRVLEKWLVRHFRTKDPGPIAEMFETFREIRRRRQKPAHAIEEDVFHQGYFKEQRELVIRAYDAVRTLRLILENHPAAQGYKVPDKLDAGKIWTY